jgi:hypothetical protein
MIEADIVYGYLTNDPSRKLQPVMAHPPQEESDISLEGFLLQILDFNNNNTEDNRKGVKLDFKSTDVFNNSMPLLLFHWNKMNYPVWINADIYSGPLNNTETSPVDAQVFFEGSKKLNNATLSTGWTTKWGSNFTDGHYTDNQIDEMIKGIKENQIQNDLTFPVRAGIAGQSLSQLDRLYTSLNATNPITFTIWSSANDNVNVEKLREVIFHFGLDKVYVDVPKELEDKLRLDVPVTSGSTNFLISKDKMLPLLLMLSFIILMF